jgi:hypothetical protein
MQVMRRLGELLQSTAGLPTLRDRAVAMMSIVNLYERVGAHRKRALVLYSLSQVARRNREREGEREGGREGGSVRDVSV